MSDPTFDRDLSAIAARAAYPQTPAMRESVLAAIQRTPSSTTAASRRPPLAFATTLVALVVIAAAAALAVPASREAVADFFGVEGSEVERLPDTPLPPPTDIGTIARLTTVDEASEAVGFELALPEGAGDPRAVYVLIYGTQHVAVARYDEFDLWQARLATEANFGKGVPPGVTVRDTLVGGMPARWISGGRHFVAFVDVTGNSIDASERTVDANTLIWNDGATFFRMETALGYDDAVRIAEALP